MSYVAGTAAATPSKFLHGNNGSVCVTVPSGSKTLMNVRKCSFTYSVETERIDHSGVAGWQVKQAGQQMISGTLEFIFDLANSPMASPYSLQPGSGNTYELNLNATSTANPISTLDTQVWSGPAMIENMKFAGPGPAAGTQVVTCDFSSIGVWAVPAV